MTTIASKSSGHPARRLSIALSVHDQTHHRSLATEIVKRARAMGVRGATVFQGLEGFGASGQTHRTGLLSNDAPVTVVIVDRAERIEALLDELTDLLDSVLVTIADVTIVSRRSR